MAAKKYYAVKRGKTEGIFYTWEECRASVEGCPGAEYKGFASLKEAESYLGTGKPGGGKPESGRSGVKKPGTGEPETGKPGAKKPETGKPETGRSGAKKSGTRKKAAGVGIPDEFPEPGTLLAYVDGSYDDSLKKYAFGCVFLLPDGRIYTECGSGENEQSLQHRNVTGEMLGAMYAVKTAMRNGFGHVEIRYDYAGIEKWVTGEWRSRTELTGKYAGAMREWGKSIRISFTKVAAHSNVYYNEMADKLARTGIKEGEGIPKVRSLNEMRRLAAEDEVENGRTQSE